MAPSASQFRLLLWKNWLLQRRQVVLTLFEIGLPALFTLILLLVRISVASQYHEDGTAWPAFSVGDALPDGLSPPSVYCNTSAPIRRRFWMAYAPDSDVVKRIVERVAARLDLVIDGLGFDTEQQLEKYIQQADPCWKLDVLAGVVFTGSLTEDGQLRRDISLKLRPPAEQKSPDADILGVISSGGWYTGYTFPPFNMLGPREAGNYDGGTPGYNREGFLVLQRAIVLSLITEWNPTAANHTIDVMLKRHPYPPYAEDSFVNLLQTQFPFIVMLSFIIAAPSICKDICLEKEKRLKEMMKLMGLRSWLHWLAWFTKFAIFMTLSAALTTCFLHIRTRNGAVINYTDPWVTFTFMWLYSLTTVMFCFAISTFFNTANGGAAAGGIIFLVSYFPFFFIQVRMPDITPPQKAGASILHNLAMGFGCYIMAQYESRGVGIQWSNINISYSPDNNFTMLHVFLFFILDSIIYGLVTWYVDGIHPGPHGVPKPIHFPFTKRYWCGSNITAEQYEAKPPERGERREYFEQYGSGHKPGIQIRNLTKIYNPGKKNEKKALSDVSLDILQGQITSLLGHNGAGKTTTISILTGFLFPTSGTAYVAGYNIINDMSKIRRNLGFCPQHDVLFDTLTVEEHLIFYAKLRGMTKKLASEDVSRIIRDVHLEDKRRTQARYLSGGQKRKLSVAIALVAGSRLVILDEPSSGMDPEARRQIWDLLKTEKSGRTIILTTHSMDEADYLGDRIAIMSGGTVQCCGSSLFLKNKYGIGYHLITVKDERCDVDKVIENVKSFVPDAKLESNVGAELSFALPRQSSGQFHKLFDFLENNVRELGISGYGASVTTLEEVFLKVGRAADGSLSGQLQNSYNEERNDDNGSELFLRQDDNVSIHLEGRVARSLEPRKTGRSLWTQQFRAMLIKRMIHTSRNKLAVIVQSLVPVVFTIVVSSVLLTVPGVTDPPPYDLTLDNFNDPVAPYLVEEANCTTIVDQLTASYLDTMAETKVTRTPQVDGEEWYSNDTTMDVYLTEQAMANFDEYTRDQMTAVTLIGKCGRRATIIGHFNNEAYHTPAISLDVVLNTMVKYLVNASHRIHTVNHPLPRDAAARVDDQLLTTYTLAFIVAYVTSFGLVFFTSTFILFVVKERQVRSKLIQFVSGVHQSVYWFSSFVWDFANYLLTAVLLICVYLAFGIDAYDSGEGIGLLSVGFMLYGWAILPCTYLFSFVFVTPASAYRTLTLINIITGTAAIVIVSILKTPQLDLLHVGVTLEWICYALLPNFAFGSILGEMFINYESKRICTSMAADLNHSLEQICAFSVGINVTNPCCLDNCGYLCAYYTDSLFAFPYPGAGRGLLFLGCQGLVFFFVLFAIESNWAHHLKQRLGVRCGRVLSHTEADQARYIQGSLNRDTDMTDADILVEKTRIQNTPLVQLVNSEALVLRNLTKVYGSFIAVDNLNIGIAKGELFGLLGVNGAGKTTTFKMLTGDETVSEGDAFLVGYSVMTDIKKVHQKLGYCPQFDALIDNMTVEETLRMYARLRGYAEADINGIISQLIKDLQLMKYTRVLAKNLSGGNKRKLSTAVALVGDPPVVFLDEPTTGMDPVARRIIWDALTKACAKGRTIVLTSHSMEECEALCTRLVIMVNGSFQCLGSIQQLKSKFGEGYTLTAKINISDNGTNNGSCRNENIVDLEKVKELSKNKEGNVFVRVEHEPDSKTSHVSVSDCHGSLTENCNNKIIDLKMCRLKTFIESAFPGSTLKEEHVGLVEYEVSKRHVSWAELFRQMEYAKDKLDLEDYSVSQTSLEQVFLNFARNQLPPVETSNGGCCGASTYCCRATECSCTCNCTCRSICSSKTVPISG